MSEKANNSGHSEKPASVSWNSPSGLDLNPRPPQTVRISRRTSLALVALAIILLGLFAYGGWKRRQRQVAALADANLPKRVAPATAAAADIEKDVPSGNALAARTRPGVTFDSGQLQAPEDVQGSGQIGSNVAVAGPSGAYRQAPPIQPAYVAPQVQQVHEASPEERRIQAAYDSEQRAMAAPTSLREGFGNSNSGPATTAPDRNDAPSQLASVLQSLAPGRSATPSSLNRTSTQADPQGQNSANSKESFLTSARAAESNDYLKSTRTAPLSQYEIKAGWEIPAVMEQALNSELPGEVKALVTSNVCDTATGLYVLIPQGARLVGEYNSQLGYGQDGVQVSWNRVIYPDGSSLDLNGMIGQDAHGFSGFRDKVDHHYKRLVGFAVLTSLFAAASEVSQNQNRSVLTYPSPAEVTGSAVGQQVSDLGAQITRKNLNVQPTIKIPVGYRFNVRVNRDVLFDSPYKPLS
ncbi:MAG: TrbI/VirB10 family protein [Bryobacteraceae bacterium]